MTSWAPAARAATLLASPRLRQGCPGKILSSRNKCLQQWSLWKLLALSTRDCELESFESLNSVPRTVLRSSRGRVGVGVPNVNTVRAARAPTRRALSSAIAEAALRRSYPRTAAEGGLCSPASGRGEVTRRENEFVRAPRRG